MNLEVRRMLERERVCLDKVGRGEVITLDECYLCPLHGSCECEACNREDLKEIPPAPHYPNWRYLCPRCQQFWESPIFRRHFIQECPQCVIRG